MILVKRGRKLRIICFNVVNDCLRYEMILVKRGRKHVTFFNEFRIAWLGYEMILVKRGTETTLMALIARCSAGKI